MIKGDAKDTVAIAKELKEESHNKVEEVLIMTCNNCLIFKYF